MVRPDGLFLELCSERTMLLAMDKDAYVEVGKWLLDVMMIRACLPRYGRAHKETFEMPRTVIPAGIKGYHAVVNA